ncbi:hypothetical protein CONLIGDRAFT_601363 [Coniochaeta ligniaria NRRL 30616]|uniref:CBM-cenC domain-containing protein n=1 Tax=Coniochaeta ligniaria NRRL 30616 TaxID=1408157 RepID=A0A1J7J089_9PEZI|nr:hypothetical protein CONLIGDRAFT_601363 [Coniochaeta ligniaria NRRL 30616]
MRPWTLCFGASILAGVANAGCISCGSLQCFGAVAADLAVGESFCSSWLSLEPATTTVTEIETATSTLINIETALTTLTLTTATTTQTEGNPTTVYLKREAPTNSAVDPAEAIVSQCSSIDTRISKACSCFLSTATASTVTTVATVVSSAVVEFSSTVSETATTNVVATVSVAAPAATIPANVVVNGNFETYLTTGNMLPWTDTTATTGGRVQIIDGVNPCTAGGAYCAGGRVVIRAYPPTAGGGYTGIRETFDARPSTTYAVTFLFRCLNFDGNSRVDVAYEGVVVGTASCPAGSSSAFNLATGIQFTTGPTGRGELQVRFVNPSNLPYLYYYADDFKAIAV